MTNYQKIEASREVRLWISQVLIPAGATLAALCTVPEIRNTVADKFQSMKSKVIDFVNR